MPDAPADTKQLLCQRIVPATRAAIGFGFFVWTIICVVTGRSYL